MLHMCNNVHKELPTLTAVWFFQFKFLILLKGPYQKPSIYRRKKNPILLAIGVIFLSLLN